MNTISAGEFIKQVAEATGCTQVQVKAILNAAGEQIKTNLKKGNEMLKTHPFASDNSK